MGVYHWNKHKCDIFETIVQKNYYTMIQYEFMRLTKPELDKNFVFFIFTMKENRDIILKNELVFNYNKL